MTASGGQHWIAARTDHSTSGAVAEDAVAYGWSRRMVTLLVMQTLDNAIALRPKKLWLVGGWRVVTEQNRERLNPTYIDVANPATQWLAQHTKGIAQSTIVEALANIPTTAHVL